MNLRRSALAAELSAELATAQPRQVRILDLVLCASLPVGLEIAAQRFAPLRDSPELSGWKAAPVVLFVSSCLFVRRRGGGALHALPVPRFVDEFFEVGRLAPRAGAWARSRPSGGNYGVDVDPDDASSGGPVAERPEGVDPLLCKTWPGS